MESTFYYFRIGLRRITHLLFAICSFVVVPFSDLSATSLVYNLRVRRVFAGLHQFLGKEKKALLGVTALPIMYKRNAHIINEQLLTNICDKRQIGGSLFNIRYIPSPSWWVEATTGILRETSHVKGTAHFCASRTGLDDIVVAGGYNAFFSNKGQLGIYGLFGIPTRWSVTLQEAQGALVGSRFYSVGAGIEFSKPFYSTSTSTITGVAQGRIIHFFSRHWQPIIPDTGKINPGELIDVLFSVRYLYKTTLFEAAYNPSFFINQALILPDRKIATPLTVRHGGVVNIAHLTSKKIFDNPLVIGSGISATYTKRIDAFTFAWWINLTLVI